MSASRPNHTTALRLSYLCRRQTDEVLHEYRTRTRSVSIDHYLLLKVSLFKMTLRRNHVLCLSVFFKAFYEDNVFWVLPRE